MEYIDSLNYDTQVAIRQLEIEKVEYKLKYKHLCDLINMMHDTAFSENDIHLVRSMNLINSLQFQYCNEVNEKLKNGY